MNKPVENPQQQVAVNVNLDTTPILYTDQVFMTTNSYGLTLDVGQRLASTNQVKIVARVGMSREHAKKLVDELGKLLAMTEGKVDTGKN